MREPERSAKARLLPLELIHVGLENREELSPRAVLRLLARPHVGEDAGREAAERLKGRKDKTRSGDGKPDQALLSADGLKSTFVPRLAHAPAASPPGASGGLCASRRRKAGRGARGGPERPHPTRARRRRTGATASEGSPALVAPDPAHQSTAGPLCRRRHRRRRRGRLGAPARRCCRRGTAAAAAGRGRAQGRGP